MEEPFKDKQPHLYQLILKPDNTYSIKVDHRVVNDGSLFIDFTPPVNPSKEIDDPTDKKPTDWDEREKVILYTYIYIYIYIYVVHYNSMLLY